MSVCDDKFFYEDARASFPHVAVRFFRPATINGPRVLHAPRSSNPTIPREYCPGHNPWGLDKLAPVLVLVVHITELRAGWKPLCQGSTVLPVGHLLETGSTSVIAPSSPPFTGPFRICTLHPFRIVANEHRIAGRWIPVTG